MKKNLAHIICVVCLFCGGVSFAKGAVNKISIYESKSLDLAKDAVFLSLIGVLINIAVFIVIYRTLNNSIEVNRNSTRISAAELRPYINVSEAILNSICMGEEYNEDFFYYEINFTLKNEGKTPASKIKLNNGKIIFSIDGECFLSDDFEGPDFIGPGNSEFYKVKFLDSRFVGTQGDNIPICTYLFEIKYQSIIGEKIHAKYMLYFNADGRPDIRAHKRNMFYFKCGIQ